MAVAAKSSEVSHSFHTLNFNKKKRICRFVNVNLLYPSVIHLNSGGGGGGHGGGHGGEFD